jgi:hypothetical protein
MLGVIVGLKAENICIHVPVMPFLQYLVNHDKQCMLKLRGDFDLVMLFLHDEIKITPELEHALFVMIEKVLEERHYMKCKRSRTSVQP